MNMLGSLVYLAIGVIILASVFITQVKNTNTTGWTAGETALWGVLSLAGIAGMLIAVLGAFGVV